MNTTSLYDNAVKMVDTLDPYEVDDLVDILEERGFLTSEDFSGGGQVIEHEAHLLAERLRQQGYSGGHLTVEQHFYPEYGHIDTMYDAGRMDLEHFHTALNLYVQNLVALYRPTRAFEGISTVVYVKKDL